MPAVVFRGKRVSQHDRHLTIEEISAMLDDQLSVQKLENIQNHLTSCLQCQQEVAEIKQTVHLLHALPEPALPRSFALPTTIVPDIPLTIAIPHGQQKDLIKQEEDDAQEEIGLATPLALTDHRASKQRLRKTLRACSALAVAAGMLFVLSGLLNTIPFVQNLDVTTATSIQAPSNGLDHNSNLVTPVVAGTTNKNAPPPQARPQAVPAGQSGPTATPSVIKPAVHGRETRVPQTSTLTLPTFVIFDMNSQSGRIGLGILLFLLGSCGSMYFKRSRPIRAGP